METVFFIGQLPNANPFTSPLSTALCQDKSPPSVYTSFSFFGCPPAGLCASYLSFITEHFRPKKIFWDNVPPWAQILLLHFLNLSHCLIRSRITHECGMVVPMPALCQSAWWVRWCVNVSLIGSPSSGGQSWCISSNPGWCWIRWSFVGIRFHLRERKQINHVEIC